jgi:hypothetical protein
MAKGLLDGLRHSSLRASMLANTCYAALAQGPWDPAGSYIGSQALPHYASCSTFQRALLSKRKAIHSEYEHK